MPIKIEYQIEFILESEMDAPMVGIKYSNCSMYAAAILRTLVSVQCTSYYASKWCKTISEGVLLFSFFIILFVTFVLL